MENIMQIATFISAKQEIKFDICTKSLKKFAVLVLVIILSAMKTKFKYTDCS